MKTVLIFVYTEYHLIIAINEIMKLYFDKSKYNVFLYIRAGEGVCRIKKDLNFDILNINVVYCYSEIKIDCNLTKEEKREIEKIIELNIDIFIFFQEQDPFMIILGEMIGKKGGVIHLYQDGLKPYVHLKYHSLGLIQLAWRTNKWLKGNGYTGEGLMYLWNSKKYAHLKSIDKLYLTFPEIYENWNMKEILKIKMTRGGDYENVLDSIYDWEDSLLQERENIIFYMNQPMHDDGTFETKFLTELIAKFANTKIYIKLHPLTHNIEKIKLYKNIPNVMVIKSLIPAELFIMKLKESIVLSINSTSMFLDNPNCKLYYLSNLFKNQIQIIKRYKILKYPPHIKIANSIDDILF